MGKVYEMTAADMECMAAAAASPNEFFKHFFLPKGSDHCFQLDYNFTEEGKWQEEMCMALQTFIVSICGIGTGKTLGVGMAAGYHGVLTPGFKFMNVANESWQSQQMFEMIMEQAEGTIFQQMIHPIRHPFHKIDIEYKLGEQIIRSSLQFMSLGEKGTATNIFTWRGDWINIDEAWLIDNLADVVSNLSTRLTGSTAQGRPYLGRMSLTSNPGESPDLWMFYDQAQNDHENGLVFNIDTRTNKNVTDKQVKEMVKHLSAEQQIRFLTGRRTEGKGKYFTQANVDACMSPVLSAAAMEGVNNNVKGYVVKEEQHLGCYEFMMPPKEGHVYFQLADPGSGAAPARNAPVIGIFDVTEAPSVVPLIGFWWGNGGNSIMPFTLKYLELLDSHKPIFAGVDNTGPQKGTAEVINAAWVHGQKKSVEAITGLDFSGSKRYSYLVALRLSIENQMFQWPHIVTGIGIQHKNYDPIVDRNPNSKLAQDIVAMFAMAAFAIRAFYPRDDDEESDQDTGQPGQTLPLGRHSRDPLPGPVAVATSRRAILVPRNSNR